MINLKMLNAFVTCNFIGNTMVYLSVENYCHISGQPNEPALRLTHFHGAVATVLCIRASNFSTDTILSGN